MSVFISKQLTVPSLGKALSDYAVGESVFVPVNGVQKEFLVVQQGKPSSVYDDSCDGTWLLMKDIYTNRVWDSTNNDYANSDIHAYLKGTLLGLFDAKVQSIIKQVKIPYTKGDGLNGSVATGTGGLSTKIFLPSFAELGISDSMANVEGAVLGYFKGANDSKRIAYLNGTAAIWWSRSPYNMLDTTVWHIKNDGVKATNSCVASQGARPCIILPYDTLFDPDTNEVKA